MRTLLIIGEMRRKVLKSQLSVEVAANLPLRDQHREMFEGEKERVPTKQQAQRRTPNTVQVVLFFLRGETEGGPVGPYRGILGSETLFCCYVVGNQTCRPNTVKFTGALSLGWKQKAALQRANSNGPLIP